MTDRPILFSGEMVKAILEGRKTVTRRILKPQPTEHEGMNCKRLRFYDRKGNLRADTWSEDPMIGAFTPYQVGDRLWVRETWRQAWPRTDYSPGVIFAADRAKSLGMQEYAPHHKWRVSIHMPRWASRITLHVTDVRVQRLQEISEAAAMEEGVAETDFYDAAEHKVAGGAPWTPGRLAFADLWTELNGQGSWFENPWVAAISFRPVVANIDSEAAR